MATKKKTTVAVSISDLKKNQSELYAARVKNSLRSLDNVSSIRATKKMIAQQKTALTAK